MEYEAARAAAAAEQEAADESVEVKEVPEVTDDEPASADDAPPEWADFGDAKQAVLTALAEAKGRQDGKALVGKAGYSYGTLRHHFGELQTWGYIDRKKDGYALTPVGRALIPPKVV